MNKVLAGASINSSDDGTTSYASPGIAYLAPYSVGYIKCMSRWPECYFRASTVITDSKPENDTVACLLYVLHGKCKSRQQDLGPQRVWSAHHSKRTCRQIQHAHC